ncbi:MAG: hypothetical protein ABWZ99_18290 [Ilumatobacteraceae bacterium]
MSVTDLTTQAAWMAGLAIVVLLLTGWRKNARAAARIPRESSLPRRKWAPIGVAETTAPLYKRPSIFRRIWAVVAGSGLAIVIGVVIATVTAFGLAWLVTTMTDLLKQ